MITKEQVLDALRYVDDPDLKKDLVTLGMIKDLEVEGNKVNFTVELTTPACPMKDMIQKACENAVLHYVSSDVDLNITMTARVTASVQTKTGILPKVKNIIAVASGKGGVGKSTVAANLAVAFAELGAKVGLVDADIYGPSAHIMFGLRGERPDVRDENGRVIIVPIERYGVKVLSIGMMVDNAQAVAWRGPMASRALQQLFTDADWGELDYLIVDLPPGTGDIHITLTTMLPLTAAVIVSTPQDVALADARKGLALFQMENINIPVLGLIENMAWFTPAELPNNKYYIFGKDGVKDLAEKLGLPLLGQIPIVQSICESGDIGKPIVLSNEIPVSKAFESLAENVAQQIAIANSRKSEVVASA